MYIKKIERKTTKIISTLLILIMLFSTIPINIIAFNNSDQINDDISENINTYASDITDESEASQYVLYEVEEKRNGNTKEFRMSDGSYTITTYQNDIHYNDNNTWKEIDNTLVERNGNVVNTASDVSFAFSSNTDELPGVEATLDEYKVVFEGIETPDVSNEAEESETANEPVADNADSGENSDETAYEAEIYETEFEVAQSDASEETVNESLSAEADSFENSDEPVSESADNELTAEEETTADISAAETNEHAAETLDEHSEQVSAEEQTNFSIQIHNPSTQIVDDGNENAERQTLDEAANPITSSSSIAYTTNNGQENFIYDLNGRNLKESIVVKSNQSSYQYTFALELENLTPVTAPNGSISLVDDNETIFSIPAPYMTDANGSRSDSVSYTLTNIGNGSYRLTVTADADWINDSSRSFPVMIDPSLYTHKNSASDNSIVFEYASAGDLSNTHEGEFYAGKSPTHGALYSHIKINNLPVIPYNARFCKAWIAIPIVSYTGTESSFHIYAQGSLDVWNSQFSTTTNSNPILDYQTAYPLPSSDTGYYLNFEVTKTAQLWYDSSDNNKGITFYSKATNGSNLTSNTMAYFSSNSLDSSGNLISPYFIVNYRNMHGLEDYYSYHSDSAGRAGTAYISDYTGGLTLVHTDVSDPGYTLSHVYNSSYGDWLFTDNIVFNTVDYSNMVIGAGWKLNAQESVVTYTYKDANGADKTALIYTDGDGTEHYFFPDAGSTTVFRDEDGLGLKITKNGINCTMSDDKNNKKFFRNGYLYKINDSNGNITAFVYNGEEYDPNEITWLPAASGNKLTSIVQHNKGKTAYTIATLTYSGNVLVSIKDRYDRETTYTLGSASLLNGITEADGTALSYCYGGGNYRMSRAYDGESKTALNFSFRSGKPDATSMSRIHAESATSEFGTDDVSVQRITGFNMTASGMTKVRDFGNDNTQQTDDDFIYMYVFDSFGRTVSSSCNGNGGISIGSSGGTYVTNTGTSRKNNHILSEGSTGIEAHSLLKNGDAELSTGWSGIGSSSVGSAAYSTENKKSGSRSIKMDLTSDTGTINLSQSLGTVPAGRYTITAYVKASEEEFTPGTESESGFSLNLSGSDCTTVRKDILNNTTSDHINEGWERVSLVTDITTAGSFTLYLTLDHCIGTVYIDEIQMSVGDGERSFNFVSNSSFTNGISDATASVNAYCPTSIQQHGGSWGKVLQLTGKPNSESVYSKQLPINLTSDQASKTTFLFSGWAYTTGSVPTDQDGRTFQISAQLTYADGSIQYATAKFNADTANQWQFACVPVIPNKSLNITSVTVHCSYKQNCGLAYFDDLSLTMDPCSSYQYNDDGNIVASNSTNKDELQMGYSGADLISSSGGANGNFSYTYDSKHNITKATNDNLSMDITYDTGGRALTSTLSGTGSDAFMKTSATYNAQGDRVASTTDNLGNTTSYTYSGSSTGAYSTITAPNSNSNTYNSTTTTLTGVNNAIGRSTMNYISGVSSIDYGYTNGNLTTLSRGGYIPGNSTKQTQNYTLTYDIFGNMTESKVGTRTLATYSYDENGNKLQSVSFGNGANVSYTYDNQNRITTKTENGCTESYEYDGNGNISRLQTTYVNSSAFKTTIYRYDTIGRLTSSIQRNENGTLLRSLENTYDSKGRLSSYKYYDGTVENKMTYTYNSNGTVLRMFKQSENETYASEIINSYDSLNRNIDKSIDYDTNAQNAFLIHTDYADGFEENRTTGLVSKYSYMYGSASMKDICTEYEYDNIGNITKITRKIGTGTAATVGRYIYDNQNRLVLEEVYGDGDAYTNVYEYDTYGNIRTVKKYNSTGYASPEIANSYSTPISTINYGYTDETWKDLLTSYDDHTITYDSIGNPLSYYNGKAYTLTWSNGRQLRRAVDNDSNKIFTYSYGSDGRLSGKTVGTGSKWYTYKYYGDQLVEMKYNQGLLRFFFDDNGRPLGVYYTDKYNITCKYYYVYNAQGDVIQIRNANNTIAATYMYDAWGKLISIKDSLDEEIISSVEIGIVNPIRYRGYLYDNDTGFYYTQSGRYYDPATRRFLNPEGYTSGGTGINDCNMFAYSNNNPVGSTSTSTASSGAENSAESVKSSSNSFTAQEFKTNFTIRLYPIIYNVPLYNQGGLRLCWAFCQVMVENYKSGTPFMSQEQATERAIELAKSVNGDNWDRGANPTNCDKYDPKTKAPIAAKGINSIKSLYSALVKNGPLYACYNGPNGAHLVVVTGVDLEKGIVYTNNPWGISGIQTYDEFLRGFAGGEIDRSCTFWCYYLTR